MLSMVVHRFLYHRLFLYQTKPSHPRQNSLNLFCSFSKMYSHKNRVKRQQWIPKNSSPSQLSTASSPNVYVPKNSVCAVDNHCVDSANAHDKSCHPAEYSSVSADNERSHTKEITEQKRWKLSASDSRPSNDRHSYSSAKIVTKRPPIDESFPCSKQSGTSDVRLMEFRSPTNTLNYHSTAVGTPFNRNNIHSHDRTGVAAGVNARRNFPNGSYQSPYAERNVVSYMQRNMRGKEHGRPNNTVHSNNSFRLGRAEQGTAIENVSSDKLLASSEGSYIFDICPVKEMGPVKLNSSLLIKNKEGRRGQQAIPEILRLRPGMFLLKNYLKHNEQVEIIKRCREFGVGSGGFYRPAYKSGAKLSLHMMCLGKNWDPETRLYEDKRSVDGAVPPVIPDSFSTLVRKSLQDSHEFIEKTCQVKSVPDELPDMIPDLCIVNFYTNSGKLGLHQDRDESEESIGRGLPVVSFSLGDAAEFLYGDDRDVEKAEKVELYSGDVLIFGGKSRLVFHGVPRILPNSAPKILVEETNLRSGRLNLTFRQY